jgi:excisionase family DNA binding protein
VTDRLVTARAVSKMLDVSVETVLRWAASGKLPSIRLSSRAIRFRESAIEEWIVERERGATGREGVSHHDGRALVGGYSGVTSMASAITPPEGGDNRGGS